MRIILFTLLTLGILQAQSIHQLIGQSLKQHPSLQTINYRLSAMDEKIALSQNFEDPDVSLTVNDIQFEDPLSRDLEPMQYQALNFKQKFPWFGKLEAHKQYTQTQKKVLFDSYSAAKVNLVYQVRVTAYTIKEVEARIDIVHNYINVAKQNIKLYTSYASTESKNHTNSMNASILLTKAKIKAQTYKRLLKTQKAKLKYLVQSDVKRISDQLRIKKPKKLHYYLSKIDNNPLYHQSISQNNVAVANQKIQSLETMPDPYVKVGYFNRTDFNDFASITIGASIPLYGSEKLKIEMAKKEVLATSSASLDYKYALIRDIKSMYAKLTETYTIYNILNKETLPQLKHMFELAQASIQEGGNLFAYTNLLEQKLNLEEESISIKAEYFRTRAKLKSLIGEL